MPDEGPKTDSDDEDREDEHREDEDVAFQRLLADLIAAVERGERVDRDALDRDYPRYAKSICEFLDDHERLHGAVDELFEPPSEEDPYATLHSSEDHRSGSRVWSLARFGETEFPISFGDYSLLREIDRGGMGIVFEALHCSLNRVVALKIMRTAGLASEEELRRFRFEAEASAAIKHPNIVPIFEVGEAHGLVYFTMAFVDGEDLSSLVRRRQIQPREAAKIMSKVADAVATAHRQGVIHRDLKPSNILVDEKGEPYLIDFGLAKQEESRDALTCAGQILGTPAYMAPEQASGKCIQNPASCDLYSLGAVLYELLTRQAPFHGPTPFDVLLQVVDRDPARPRQLCKQIPRDLETICMRAMEKDPAQRYPSAEQMQLDLQRFLLNEPILRPRPTLSDRMQMWWRREPILVSHLCGIFSVLLVVIAAQLIRETDSQNTKLKVTLLLVWLVGSLLFQRLSVVNRMTDVAHWLWAAFDVATYTTLIYWADPPRGLLLVGYPMMITASGLFYRARFVVFVTSVCAIGFLLLCVSVEDPMTLRTDFCVIYLSGLVVLGLCLVSMIRRVRGLSDYFGRGNE
ncbi:serine/threonine-protein kinase [Novipirellula artificiosorum]|uniref:non-specific serine/threonine protein kinase n=1 Tax=Novipirellula artificiosorum TaxID=2528016 RepID=A0A5C6E1V5_9BACT|nr:serine/threonine-protein kinase [Novipirellula artificiosorum]TWU42838.1 Serine/threonine-protein kinase PrkC [Novipirellula artificiosorum]